MLLDAFETTDSSIPRASTASILIIIGISLTNVRQVQRLPPLHALHSLGGFGGFLVLISKLVLMSLGCQRSHEVVRARLHD